MAFGSAKYIAGRYGSSGKYGNNNNNSKVGGGQSLTASGGAPFTQGSLVQNSTRRYGGSLWGQDEDEEEKNRGGLLGGIGYAAGNVVLGAGTIVEGLSDLLLAGGALLVGDTDYAEWVFKDNTVGSWRESLNEAYNPDEVMSFVGDVGNGVGQSSTFLLNVVPGLGTGLFFAGMASQGISGAAAQTGEVGLKEVAYGVASGGVEAVLGTVLSGASNVAKSVGKSAMTSLTKNAAKSTFSSVTKNALRQGIGKKVLSSAASEFAEEFTSTYADALLQRITGVDPNATVTLKEALYAGAVGAVSGGLTTGVAGVTQNAHNAKRGARIISNGNADIVINEANHVADRIAAQGTDFENAQEWITALRGEVDAYNALSPEAKVGLRGKTILGEMQASLYFAETQANVDLIKKGLKKKTVEDKEALAAYVNRVTGRKYTATDIDNNTDNLTGQLAVLHYASGIMNFDAAILQEQGIGNKIATEQGTAPAATEVAQGGNEVERAQAMPTADNAQMAQAVQSEAVEVGETKRDIVNLQDGKTYVKASRNVISGNNVSEWRKQISNFFTELLDGEESMDISTIEGDVLTITKNETAQKARDRYRQVNGKKQKLSDDEFKVKLTAESHIDEIAEVSTKNKNNAADTKNHSFAKDGFNYRTAYFQDFDGQYYQVTLSVGNNGDKATIYNVGKIKEDKLPSANIIAVVGSKTPRSLSSNNSIPQKSDLSTQNDKKDLAIKDKKTAQEGAEASERADVSEAQQMSADGKSEAQAMSELASSSVADESATPSPALWKSEVESEAKSEAESAEDIAARKARAEERAKKWAEWEENTKPTAEELNAARESVKGFDGLENDRRLGIVRTIRSAEGKVDQKIVKGVTNLMAMRKKNGQSVAPDLEFRFVEGLKKDTAGLRTHIGDKTVVLVDSSAEYNDTIRSTIAHELVHYIENKEGYKELAEFAKANATAEHIAEIENEYIEYYEENNEDYTPEKLDSEVVGRLVGKALNSEKFLARYAQKDDKLIKKVGRFLKGIVTSQKDDADVSKVAGKMMEMFDKALQSESVGESSGDKKSIAGRKAMTADKVSLSRAKEMLADGVDSETIRQETGWFKGYDGKWRFEIDDSEMKVSVPDGKYLKVGDMVDHPKLFEAYPELKDIYVTFLDLDGKQGSYSRVFGDIELSRDLLSSPDGLKSVIAHELQHAIQDIEGFARGASTEYWEKRLVEGYDSRQAYVKAEEKALLDRIKAMRLDDANNDTFFVSDMEDLEKMRPDHPRGKIDWDTLEQIEEDSPQWKSFDRQRDQLSEVYGEARVFNYLKISSRLEQIKHLGERFAHDLYFQTAGEVEARDVQKRLHLDETQRKNTRPDIDQEDVVFAKGVSFYQAGSIDEDEDVKSIRQQLEKSKDKLAEITPVKSKYPLQKFKNAKETLEWAVNVLKSSGQLIQRQGYGDVVLDEKRLKNGLSYLKTDAEKVAFSLIPKVIKNGIEVGRHPKHKGRNYDTVTFALPVTVGDTTGHMVVVIREEGKKYFKLHRVFMPDGGLFKFTETKKSNAETAGLQNANVSPTNVASNISISQKSDLSTQIDKKDLAPKKKKEDAEEKSAKKTEQKTDDVKKLRKMSEQIAKEKAKLSREQKAMVFTKQEIGVALDSIEALTDIEVLRLANGMELQSLTRERREELTSQIYISLHNASAEGESGRGSVVVKRIATTIAQDIIDHARIVDENGKSYHFKDVYDAASLSKIVQDKAQTLYESFANMGTQTSNSSFQAAVRAVKEDINVKYANDRLIAKESREVSFQATRLREMAQRQKRGIEDDGISLLTKTLGSIVDAKGNIVIGRIDPAIAEAERFFAAQDLKKEEGGLTTFARDNDMELRYLIDELKSLREGREGKLLDGHELKLLGKILGGMHRTIKEYNQVFVNGHWMDADKVASDSATDITSFFGDKQYKNAVTKFLGEKVGKRINELYFYNILSPENVIEALEGYQNGGVLKTLYHSIRVAKQRSEHLSVQLKKPFAEFLDAKGEVEVEISQERDFSISNKTFAEQIDEVISGTHNPRLDLYVSETPKILTDLNLSEGPLMMRNSKIKEIFDKHPEMSDELLKKIPQAIKDPVLVLKSKTHPTESIVVITDIITSKGEMIVPIWINQEGNYIDINLNEVVTSTNFVASAYGRNIKTLIQYANENEGFLYQAEDEKRVEQLLARNGLRLSTPLKLSDSTISIPQKRENVKPKEKNTKKQIISPTWTDEKGRKRTYRQKLNEKIVNVNGNEITLGEGIYLYMLTKREHTHEGLREAGFVTYDENNQRKKKFKVEDVEAARGFLWGQFDAADKAYIAMAEEFFNKTATDIKAEADMEILGFTNNLSGYYVPIIRDRYSRMQGVTDMRQSVGSIVTVYNKSFNQNTVQNAKALEGKNIQSIINDHADGLADYKEMYLPLKAFDRVYNRRVVLSDGTSTTIREVLNNDVWNGSQNYLKNLFSDIQGDSRRRDGFVDDIVGRLRSGWVNSVLGLNLKVVATQTTSYVAANQVIEAKYLVPAIAKFVGNQSDLATRADKYSDIIEARSFDMGSLKAQGNVDRITGLGKKSGFMIEAMDRRVCMAIFHAAELKAEAQGHGKVGTVENAKAAAKIADEVIYTTQAMTSQAERSALQRSPSEIAKAFSMFTSDTVKNLSHTWSSVMRYIAHSQRAKKDSTYQQGLKKDARKIGRSAATMAMTGVMLGLITQAFKYLYAKEEEEPEDKVEDLATDIVSSTLNVFPIFSDIADKFIFGYDMSLNVFDIANDTIEDTKAIFDMTGKAMSGQFVSDDEIGKTVINAVKTYGALLGAPLAPVERTVTGLLRRFAPQTVYDYDAMFKNASYTKDLKKAVESGNEELAEHILTSLYKNEATGVYASEELEEIVRLYGLVDEDGKHPDVLPQRIGTNIDGVTLSAAQRRQFEAVYGGASNAVVRLISSDIYRDMTDEERIKAIKNTYKLYYNRAKSATLGTQISKVEVYSSLLGDKSELYVLAQAKRVYMQEYKNRRGKKVTIKEQVEDMLDDMKLSKSERLIMLYALGYTGKENTETLIKLINSLKLHDEELAQIAAALGFAVEKGKVVLKEDEAA